MLKQFFINRLLKNFLSRTRDLSSFDVSKLQRVLCLIDIDINPDFDKIRLLAKDLNIEPSQFEMIGFTNKDNILGKEQEYGLKYIVSKKKSYDGFGRLRDEQLKKLLLHEHGLLINYFDSNGACILLSNVFAKTKLRVGFSVLDKGYNDVVFDIPIKETELFTRELVKYLRILNK